MTVRDIQGHLEEIYGIEVSPDLISTVTNGIIEEVKTWQNRPLEPVYPVVFLDAVRVKIRDNGHIYNKAVYVALGINMDGHKEVLGLWIAKNEDAKFWLQVYRTSKSRFKRYFHCMCGWTKRFSRSYRIGFSADSGSIVYCAYDPLFDKICII